MLSRVHDNTALCLRVSGELNSLCVTVLVDCEVRGESEEGGSCGRVGEHCLDDISMEPSPDWAAISDLIRVTRERMSVSMFVLHNHHLI